MALDGALGADSLLKMFYHVVCLLRLGGLAFFVLSDTLQ